MSCQTIRETILATLRGGALTFRELHTEVASRLTVNVPTMRSQLSKMRSRGEVQNPARGYWSLPKRVTRKMQPPGGVKTVGMPNLGPEDQGNLDRLASSCDLPAGAAPMEYARFSDEEDRSDLVDCDARGPLTARQCYEDFTDSCDEGAIESPCFACRLGAERRLTFAHDEPPTPEALELYLSDAFSLLQWGGSAAIVRRGLDHGMSFADMEERLGKVSVIRGLRVLDEEGDERASLMLGARPMRRRRRAACGG